MARLCVPHQPHQTYSLYASFDSSGGVFTTCGQTAIRFKFEPPDKLEAQWHFMLHELRAFRDRYGHADPPDGFLEPASDLNPDLVGWVNGARKLYQKVRAPPV